MEANEYQRKANETAVYPGSDTQDGLEYVLFGLVGEAGEVANKYKKILRNQENYLAHTPVLMDELSDVLWYAALVAKELGYSLEEVMQYNITKLAKRKADGELKNR